MMTGTEIREFRRDKNWTIEYLAQVLRISVWKLQTIEVSAKAVPIPISMNFETLVRAMDAGAISSDANNPRHRFRDFRRSTSFSEKPPFAVVPHCPCGNTLCVLAPTGDGDWDGKHLWKFVGRVCHKTCHVDSGAVVVPRPLRRPPRDLAFDDFHDSANFSITPPFRVVPSCPCGSIRCRLLPQKDGVWDGIHLWKFKSWKCQRVRYVNSQGEIVSIPRGSRRDPNQRHPLLRKPCSLCGRIRFSNRQYRKTLGCYVYALYCLSKAGDAADQKHDRRELFVERNGEVSPLTEEESDKLRRRSKQEFAAPRCELSGCPRFGKRLERSSELSRNDKSGKTRKLLIYYCRPPIPFEAHHVYRVFPRGESAQRVGTGRYVWIDATTGVERETVLKQRSLRADRVMPVTRCKLHDRPLTQGRGPWALQGHLKRWRATCPFGGESYWVRSDGALRAVTRDAKWDKGGRRPLAVEQRQNFVVGQRVEQVLPRFERIVSCIRSLPAWKRRKHEELRAVLEEMGTSKAEIAAVLQGDRPLTAARWFISIETHISYDVVTKYHRYYLKTLRKPDQK
jgi:hypothetical protein